jgi:hypothetical protein
VPDDLICAGSLIGRRSKLPLPYRALGPRRKRWTQARAGQRTLASVGPDAYLVPRAPGNGPCASSIKVPHAPPLTLASRS